MINANNVLHKDFFPPATKEKSMSMDKNYSVYVSRLKLSLSSKWKKICSSLGPNLVVEIVLYHLLICHIPRNLRDMGKLLGTHAQYTCSSTLYVEPYYSLKLIIGFHISRRLKKQFYFVPSKCWDLLMCTTGSLSRFGNVKGAKHIPTCLHGASWLAKLTNSDLVLCHLFIFHVTYVCSVPTNEYYGLGKCKACLYFTPIKNIATPIKAHFDTTEEILDLKRCNLLDGAKTCL